MENINEITSRLSRMEKKIDQLRVNIGKVESRQIRSMHIEKLSDAEFQVFSQWGEDGILQYLIHHLDISRNVFVEFGVENYTESNTRFLLINNNWSGLVIDGSKENIDFIKNNHIYWRYNLKAECSFITAENINDLIRRNGLSGKIGILSVDIDGVDYWVWKSIYVVEPDIVICEYNYRLGKEAALTVPYDANFVRNDKHFSNVYYGASIKAMVLLANEKGYALVGGNSSGNNLFFVKKELLNDKIKECSIDEAYVEGRFRESRDETGKLNYLSADEEKNLLHKLPFVCVDE